jgi:hypothetical protein
MFPYKNLLPWRDLNPGLLVPEADAMSTVPRRQGFGRFFSQTHLVTLLLVQAGPFSGFSFRRMSARRRSTETIWYGRHQL